VTTFRITDAMVASPGLPKRHLLRSSRIFEKQGHPPVVFFVRSYAAEIYIHHAVTQTLLAILSPAEVGDYADHGMCTLSRRTAIAVRYRPQPSSLMGLAAHGSHFAKSQAFFKGRRRFSLPIWTDSSLRIRIRNILGTGSGGGAALTNRLFSDTPDSGCVRHGSGSKVPIEGIKGASHLHVLVSTSSRARLGGC
jgi:hypothetical protein